MLSPVLRRSPQMCDKMYDKMYDKIKQNKTKQTETIRDVAGHRLLRLLFSFIKHERIRSRSSVSLIQNYYLPTSLSTYAHCSVVSYIAFIGLQLDVCFFCVCACFGSRSFVVSSHSIFSAFPLNNRILLYAAFIANSKTLMY